MDTQRLGISGITTREWTLSQDIGALRRHGIKNIGVWSFKCEGQSPLDMGALIKKQGLHVSSYCFGGLFTGISEQDRIDAIAETKRAIDVAKVLAADCLLLVSGPIRSHSPRQALDFVRDALRKVTQYAASQRVHLGLEALHPMDLTQWSVVNTVPAALELVEELNSPWLGVILDTYNIGWDPTILTAITRCKGKIKGVHLADWRDPTRSFTDRALPGHGVIPIFEIMAAIEHTGYQGSYDLEIFSDELWSGDYDSIMEEMRQWFTKIPL
ncbi:MAG: sugar phosphate isomerase/epimerase family protein [Bacilli bacterium]